LARGRQEKAMNNELDPKLSVLKRCIEDTGGLAVAFSGGVDSTLLAAVAFEVLGDRALAVTASSPLYPTHEQQEAKDLACQIGIRHLVVESDELDVPGFADNPPNRCYLCKTELFELISKIAVENGIDKIADGTTLDDEDDYRPGRKAALEQGVLSPLLEAGLTKCEVRKLSKDMGLPTADKAAFACLASRFPYGVRITQEKLAAVDAVETKLRELGFRQFRVRHHGDVARIEVEPDEIARTMDEEIRNELVKTGHAAGFKYIAVDLQGYRTGSMNETLGK
jgi:uncharacterized protein